MATRSAEDHLLRKGLGGAHEDLPQRNAPRASLRPRGEEGPRRAKGKYPQDPKVSQPTALGDAQGPLRSFCLARGHPGNPRRTSRFLSAVGVGGSRFNETIVGHQHTNIGRFAMMQRGL